MSRLLELMKTEKLFFDGAMGTLLINYPEYSGKEPALLNLTHPEIITDIHKKYVDVGCNLITTNTFDVNPEKYENYAEIVSAAIANARAATGDRKDCFVGLDIGPIGKLMYPMGLLKPEDAYAMFKAMVLAGTDADFIIIETMIDENETREALRAAKENSSLPVFVSNAYNQRGRLLTTGARPADVAAIANEFGADAIGANCSFGPDKMLPIIKAFKAATELPVFANPNAGLPEVVDGKPTYNVTPEEFVGHMREIEKLGVTMLGGCCGTTPEYIGLLIQELRGVT